MADVGAGVRQRPSITPRSRIRIIDHPYSSARRAERHSVKGNAKGKSRAFGWGRWQGLREGWVEEGFRRFGEHCARNQIRTLLIDCLVMTNLFYPSLAVYLQKRFPRSAGVDSNQAGPSRHRSFRNEHPLTLFSTPLLDSVFPEIPPLIPRLGDRAWWEDEDERWEIGLQRDMPWLEEELRIMRVAWASVSDILDGSDDGWDERDWTVLRYLRDMADEWELGQCIRTEEGGECGMLDLHTGSTLDETPQTTNDVYRGVAIPFTIPRNASASFDMRWAQTMDELSRRHNAELFRQPRDTRQGDWTGTWSLSFNHAPAQPVQPPASTGIPKIIYALYLTLFSVLGHELSNASKVHSQFGLAFTGIVQLCCSTVMSFSILTLLGWNGWGTSMGVGATTLPTYILPFVIVVVGAENMSTLTKAVFSVPFTYSVPARIGIALSKVGTTISFASLSDLLLLGVIWLLFNIPPVREFCVFAAVLIVTDWFMLHTFFLTVLSIDAQRLELADVLASSDTQAKTPEEEQARDREPQSNWRKLFQARMAKGGSLFILLCCVGVIYWLTERHRQPASTASLYGYNPANNARPSPSTMPSLSGDYAETLWRSINPQGWPTIIAKISEASIIILPKTGHSVSPAALRQLASQTKRWVRPRIRPLLSLLKVTVLPQAMTAGLLYVVLLYLLKDTDLLDAQRNRLGRGEKLESSPDEGVVQRLRVRMLNCASSSDTDILKPSDSGSVVLSLGVDGAIGLWRFIEGGGTRESLSIPDDAVAVDIAVSLDGGLIAVATRDAVHLWKVLGNESPVLIETIRLPKIRSVAFTTPAQEEDPFKIANTGRTAVLAATTGNVYVLDESGSRTIIEASEKVHLLRGSNLPTSVLLEARPVQLWTERSTGWICTELHSTCVERDTIRCTRLFGLNEGEWGNVIAIGWCSGLVEVFDTSGFLLITVRHEAAESLHLAYPPTSECLTCHNIMRGFYLITVTTATSYVDFVHPRNAFGCRCSIKGRRSVSLDESPPVSSYRDRLSIVIPPGATRRTPVNSPKKSPTLLPVTNGEFPLSSHGTRRLSTLHLHREDGVPGSVGGAGGAGPSSPDEVPLWSDLNVTPLGAIASFHGGASILSEVLVVLHKSGRGVDDYQWRIITLNLSSCWNGTELVVQSANLGEVADSTRARGMGAGGLVDAQRQNSIHDQRRERMLSLSGRRSFPSISGGSGGGAGAEGMAYVSVEQLIIAGDKILGGFGNRLGVIQVEAAEVGKAASKDKPLEMEKERERQRINRSRAGSSLSVVPEGQVQGSSGMLSPAQAYGHGQNLSVPPTPQQQSLSMLGLASPSPLSPGMLAPPPTSQGSGGKRKQL